MDFKAAAERTNYSIYTTEFDEVRDIRSVYTEEMVSDFRDAAEQYNPIDTSFRASGDKRDRDKLERAIVELRETINNTISETGIVPSESVVGFLIDNSGSSRNMCALYARAMHRVCTVLDDLGFDSPVVGHTTVRWKGGESRHKWLSNGRPHHPGRLNDLLFTVYKEPGEPMKETDLRLYGLNSPPGTYKENIDGEALAWMAERMAMIHKVNKSMIFITDGDYPVDDSTLSTHSKDYLLDHRNAVIGEIVSSSDISLVQVVAHDSSIHIKPEATTTDMPRFGGQTPESSDLVKAIGQAIDHSLRMTFECADKTKPQHKM